MHFPVAGPLRLVRQPQAKAASPQGLHPSPALSFCALPPPRSIRGEAEKRRLLLEQLDRAGRQQLMRGRVRCGAPLPNPAGPAWVARRCTAAGHLLRCLCRQGSTVTPPPPLPAAPCCMARCGGRRRASWAAGGTATEAQRGSTSPGEVPTPARSDEAPPGLARPPWRAAACIGCPGLLLCELRPRRLAPWHAGDVRCGNAARSLTKARF